MPAMPNRIKYAASIKSIGVEIELEKNMKSRMPIIAMPAPKVILRAFIRMDKLLSSSVCPTIFFLYAFHF
jgi:hypothetical protein